MHQRHQRGGLAEHSEARGSWQGRVDVRPGGRATHRRKGQQRAERVAADQGRLQVGGRAGVAAATRMGARGSLVLLGSTEGSRKALSGPSMLVGGAQYTQEVPRRPLTSTGCQLLE